MFLRGFILFYYVSLEVEVLFLVEVNNYLINPC